MVAESVDTSAVDRLLGRWSEHCASGLTVGLVYLGDRLGLFAALRDTGRSTAAELAARTGLVERYVQEWLAAMAASGLVDHAPADQRYGSAGPDEEILSEDFRRRHRLGAYATAERALESLVDRGLVERERRSHVLIPDVFLRHWLRLPSTI